LCLGGGCGANGQHAGQHQLVKHGESPQGFVLAGKACGSAISLAVTNHGPSGVNLSKDYRVGRSSGGAPGSRRIVMSIRHE